MDSSIITIGSGIAALVSPVFVYMLFLVIFKQGKKRTNKQVNAAAALLLTGVLLGVPAVWAVSVLIVSAFSYLPPTGHLYLWGSIGILAILIGSFAGIRQLIIRNEATL